MLRLITDFDGPIMDVQDRYYCVYQYCLEQISARDRPIKQLSKAEFWQLKRSRVPEKQIGLISGLDQEQARQFARLRGATVHQLPYLVHDKLLPGALNALSQAQHLGFDLVVMTMRQERALGVAITQYGLARFFKSDRLYYMRETDRKTIDIEEKPKLLAKALQELPSAADVWMVGDTEADIVAAKTHNIKVIGVLSGIRDRPSLAMYQPDLIVDNLTEAVQAIATSIAYTHD